LKVGEGAGPGIRISDWEVTADFKCGSGLEPFIGLALLALALGVVVRRLT
jgi:hypothetical protein